MIEIVFNQKNRVFISNLKDFCEMKEKHIALNIDVFNFKIDVFNSVVVALLFVFNKFSTYLRSERIFV